MVYYHYKEEERETMRILWGLPEYNSLVGILVSLIVIQFFAKINFITYKVEMIKYFKQKSIQYTPKDGYIYYRNCLKNFILQYYSINNEYLKEILDNILLKDSKTYMFGIEYSLGKIYLYISGDVINVSDYIQKFLKGKAKEQILLKF